MSHLIKLLILSSLMLSSSLDIALIFKMYVSVQQTHALRIKTLQLIKVNLLSSQVKVSGMSCGASRCIVHFHKLVS